MNLVLEEKIAQNIRRNRMVTAVLKSKGWTVIRFLRVRDKKDLVAKIIDRG